MIDPPQIANMCLQQDIQTSVQEAAGLRLTHEVRSAATADQRLQSLSEVAGNQGENLDSLD